MNTETFRQNLKEKKNIQIQRILFPRHTLPPLSLSLCHTNNLSFTLNSIIFNFIPIKISLFCKFYYPPNFFNLYNYMGTLGGVIVSKLN